MSSVSSVSLAGLGQLASCSIQKLNHWFRIKQTKRALTCSVLARSLFHVPHRSRLFISLKTESRLTWGNGRFDGLEPFESPFVVVLPMNRLISMGTVISI